jgi:hypothetical protein
MSGSPNPSAPETEASRLAAFLRILTAENLIVLLFSEGVGLPFCYEAPDLMMHGQVIKGLVSFAIGLPFVVLGGTWPFLKERIPGTFADSVRAVLLDFRGWLAIAAIGFIYVFGPPLLVGHSKPPRHISREAAERFQDAIAPYGNIQDPTKRGSVSITRCQTLEAADLLRDIWDPFYNVHWNVREVMSEAARFSRDGAVYVQGTFPDDLDKAIRALLLDSGITAHVRRLGTFQKGQLPEIGIDVDCNE